MPDSPSDSPPPVTVRDFQELIRERYFPTDSARGSAGTFLYLIEEVGELATAIADNNRPNGRPPTDTERANLEEEFADVLAWVATLANINNVDLTATLDKYFDEGRVKGVKE